MLRQPKGTSKQNDRDVFLSWGVLHNQLPEGLQSLTSQKVAEPLQARSRFPEKKLERCGWESSMVSISRRCYLEIRCTLTKFLDGTGCNNETT